jgi:hypothetical protein
MALEAGEKESGATVPEKRLLGRRRTARVQRRLRFDSHKGPPTGAPPLPTRRVTRDLNKS